MHPSSANMPVEDSPRRKNVTHQRAGEAGVEERVDPAQLASVSPIGLRSGEDPALILADEPTAALDSARGRQVVTLFRQIADTRRAGVAVVTHDPRVQDLFDRTIELRDGRIVAENVTGSGGSAPADTNRNKT